MTEETRIAPKFKDRVEFQEATYMRNMWRLHLTEAHKLSDVENSRLWGDILSRMQRGDLIEAFKPDSGAYAKFVITEVDKGYIRLGKIESYTPVEIADPVGAPLVTKWNVGRRAFDVLRAADNTLMRSGFQTKASAVAWIEDHMKKMAA